MNIALNDLISQLNTQSDNAAEKVIAKIVSIGASAVPALIEAGSNQKSPRVRKWSLEALGAIGDKRGAPLLIEALLDERMTVRLHALKGLGRMKYKKGVKKIASLLKDSSGGIRLNALYTLMAIGDRTPLPQIQKCLADPQWYVRQNACIACGQFRAKSAKAKLKQLSSKDERKAVREAAAAALAAL